MKDGVGAPSYKALIFNNQSIISTGAAETLLDITSTGIPLIFIGSTPSQAYPVADQSKLNVAMERILSGPNIHRLDTIDKVPALLAPLNIRPRVSLNCSSSKPVYSVYRSGSDVGYVYFFNDENDDTECVAELSVQNATPFELDAWTGLETQRAASYVNNSFRGNETLLIALRQSSRLPDHSSETTHDSRVPGYKLSASHFGNLESHHRRLALGT